MTATQTEFDVNDPQTYEGFDYGDPGGSAEQLPFAPPDDGIHRLNLRLRESETKPGVYIKGTGPDLKVVAALAVRVLKEDGNLGAYLRDFYPTTQVLQGQSASNIAFLCRLAGKPLQRGMSPQQVVDHVYGVFEDAGESGITVNAKTRWIREIPVVTEEGIPVFDGEYIKRDVLKGQKAIISSVVAKAKSDALMQGYAGAELEQLLQDATAKAHIFYNPYKDEEEVVRAEIASLVA